MRYICTRNRMIARALSSVGSEHLVYTQRVGGSNPSAPTKGRLKQSSFFIYPNRFSFLKDSNEGGAYSFLFYR